MESSPPIVLKNLFLKRYFFSDSCNEHFQMTSDSKMIHQQMKRMKQQHVALRIAVKVWYVLSQEKWRIHLFYLSP